jgi:hypothetical protein
VASLAEQLAVETSIKVSWRAGKTAGENLAAVVREELASPSPFDVIVLQLFGFLY